MSNRMEPARGLLAYRWHRAPPGNAKSMLRKRLPRRIIGASLVVAGALLMWLAPESVGGAVLLAAGIILEVVGLRLERSRDETPR